MNTIFNKHFLHYYFLNRDIKKYSRYLFGEVLDVGAGRKPYKKFFRHCQSYESMDISGDHEYVSDICDNSVCSDAYDTIFCSQVLEHLPNHRFAVNEMMRILRNGGSMVITVPFSWEVHGAPNDYYRFTPYALEQLLPGCVVKANGGQWAAIGQLQCNAVRGVFKGLIPFMNIFYFILDKLFYNDKFTLNYIAVWQKPL